MFAEERRVKIVQLIHDGRPVKVTELSELFGVSESTVRRDLQELDSAGHLQRTHGGAVSPQMGLEPSFLDKEVCFLSEKQQMAKVAAMMIHDGDVVLLDAGTTMMAIARALRGKRITVATNSMDVAEVFGSESQIEVLLLGGSWRKTIRSLVGPITEQILRGLCFDKVFLAANGIDSDAGVTTQNLVEAQTKRAMLGAGKVSVLVADHSKLGQKYFAKICSLPEISCMITDSGIQAEDAECLRAYTKVVVAGA